MVTVGLENISVYQICFARPVYSPPRGPPIRFLGKCLKEGFQSYTWENPFPVLSSAFSCREVRLHSPSRWAGRDALGSRFWDARHRCDCPECPCQPICLGIEQCFSRTISIPHTTGEGLLQTPDLAHGQGFGDPCYTHKTHPLKKNVTHKTSSEVHNSLKHTQERNKLFGEEGRTSCQIKEMLGRLT